VGELDRGSIWNPPQRKLPYFFAQKREKRNVRVSNKYKNGGPIKGGMGMIDKGKNAQGVNNGGYQRGPEKGHEWQKGEKREGIFQAVCLDDKKGTKTFHI